MAKTIQKQGLTSEESLRLLNLLNQANYKQLEYYEAWIAGKKARINIEEASQ